MDQPVPPPTVSRLPRPASSPTKALRPPPSSGLPTMAPLAPTNATSANATSSNSSSLSTAGPNLKRKPSEPLFQPASKKPTSASASSSRPPSAAGSSSSSLRASTRSTSSTHPSSSTGSTAANRRAGAAASSSSTLTQPRESRLAPSRSTSSSLSSSTISGRRSPNLPVGGAGGAAAAATGGPSGNLRTRPTAGTSALSRSVSQRPGLASAGRSDSGESAGGASSSDLHLTNGRLGEVEKQIMNMNELLGLERSRIINLETAQSTLQNQLAHSKSSEQTASLTISSLTSDFSREKAAWARDVEDLERERKDRVRVEGELRKMEDELRRMRSEAREREEETRREVEREKRKVRELEEEVTEERRGREREREEKDAVKSKLTHLTTESLTLTTQLSYLQTRSTTLESTVSRLQASLAELTATTAAQLEDAAQKVDEAERKTREGETERRKLHNTIQELKGNIRVFCRVRPPIDVEGQLAAISYPDPAGTQIVVSNPSESAMGASREQTIPFQFDKVFQPASTQEDVFEEIAALTQSVLDGYNCCIFAYGQTGAGKSFTMEGGPTPETMGMIPRAVAKIFETTEKLREQGWEYEMEGQFLEIYNETINDLLGSADFDKKKHEIKHEKIGRHTKTTVTDAAVVPLQSPNQVKGLLERAKTRRAVAATLMNERSSRSHSVFSLRVSGNNSLTGESCEGVLNLVDLAGSERLASSGAGENKDRLKETININKSLSALADVIGALGSSASGSGAHVPYRNSKLTYLLQTSLSGQSKTLMVLNLSPLAAHMSESLVSLRFATKVNSTQIGTAKKVTK